MGVGRRGRGRGGERALSLCFRASAAGVGFRRSTARTCGGEEVSVGGGFSGEVMYGQASVPFSRLCLRYVNVCGVVSVSL